MTETETMNAECINIFVKGTSGVTRLFAQSGDMAEAMEAADYIVKHPDFPVVAAWCQTGDPGDILLNDAEIAEKYLS